MFQEFFPHEVYKKPGLLMGYKYFVVTYTSAHHVRIWGEGGGGGFTVTAKHMQ